MSKKFHTSFFPGCSELDSSVTAVISSVRTKTSASRCLCPSVKDVDHSRFQTISLPVVCIKQRCFSRASGSAGFLVF